MTNQTVTDSLRMNYNDLVRQLSDLNESIEASEDALKMLQKKASSASVKIEDIKRFLKESAGIDIEVEREAASKNAPAAY